MIGKHTGTRLGTGRDRGTWPVLLVLLAAAVAPSGCVLWFMNAAIRNERLAVREKLTQAYHARLVEAQQQIDQFWDRRSAELSLLPGEGPGEAFARLARSGKADGYIVMDGEGRIAYPNSSSAPPPTPATTSTPSPMPATTSAPASQAATTPAADIDGLQAQAQEAEFFLAEPERAAEIHAQLAAQADDGQTVARALLARARCLAKVGRRDEAISLLNGSLQESRFRGALDAHGRLISPSARLMAMELATPRDKDFSALAGRLVEQVNNYRDLSMPAGQRLFLMTRLCELAPGASLPTMQAELACQEMSEGPPQIKQPPGVARLTSWYAGPALPKAQIEHLRSALPSSDGRVYGLFRGRRVLEETEDLLNRPPAAVEATCRLINSAVDRPELGASFIRMEASNRHMSDWSVALFLVGPDPFAQAARKQNALYLWTGAGGIVFIAVLAMAMATYIGRQMRLTRLKNDLIATVSHELKTPLASMRVLVDTLREGRCADPRQAGEYFDLIAKENERLSRLIDNFLTFSRMERNKRAFEFAPVALADAVAAAVEAVGERFSSPDARLEVDVPADLPRVRADRDALVTVLLNLLDNAWKYSGDRKQVKLRAYAARGFVCVEVSDNGVGLSRRAAGRIFDKFYQVDQTLSRKAGGCGLGLAIVKFILEAHGGTISVKSQPGRGSTFTIRLPAADAP